MTDPTADASENSDHSDPQPAANHGEPFRLDQFLKFEGMVGTGGEAKIRIQSGEILVNGEPETRRRKKLQPGDVVQCGDETATVPESAG